MRSRFIRKGLSRVLPVAVLFALCAAPRVFAAQDGLIAVDEARIHQVPDPNGGVLARVKKGTTVRISDRETRGWYRVRFSRPGRRPVLGWIRAADVQKGSVVRGLKSAGIALGRVREREVRRHRWVISGLVNMYAMNIKDTRDATKETSALAIIPGFGAELGYRLSTLSSLSVHGSRFQLAQKGYGASGTFLGLIYDYTVMHSLPWKVSLGFGGGASMGSAAVIGGLTTESFLAPGAIAKLGLRWYPGERYAIYVQAGYRYLVSKEVAIPEVEGTSGVSLSSPFLGGGLQLEF